MYHSLYSRILDKDEEWKAKSMVYDVYCEEMGWFPSPDNPSGLKILDYNGVKILEDNFHNVSIWVGIFNNFELIG
jgi:hypothetical protein